MRRIKRFGLLVAVNFCLFGLLSGMIVMKAEAGDYIGEYCWNFTNTTFQTAGAIRLGIDHIGDNHYLCTGKVTVTSPVSLKVPVFGNAEIVDGKIIITLTIPGRRNGAVKHSQRAAHELCQSCGVN